jgi:hypothetical protein
MLGLLGRLLPWVIVFLIWYGLNRSLDKIDAKEVKMRTNKFWGKIFFLYGWVFGAQTKFTTLRWIITGIVMFLLFRWIAVSISTPF